MIWKTGALLDEPWLQCRPWKAIIVKFVRFAFLQERRWGLLDGENVIELIGSPYYGWKTTERVHYLQELRILTPADPTKMIVVGWNYAAHACETNDEPLDFPQFFPLAANSIIAHQEPVIIPADLVRVDHEAELVVVIGRQTRGVTEEEAEQCIAGFTCGNDVSARDFQWHPKDKNVARSKTVDTFSPIGPYLVTDIDYQNLDIKMRVNGELRQSSNTCNLIFSVPCLISHISRYVTLFPGDVIFTGTPAGISPVKPGDVMEVIIEHIGALRNPVVGM